MTTDTPRTYACGFCGEHDCKPYYRPHGQECRSPLCEVTERAKKAEAEAKWLRSQLNRAVEVAETACRYLDQGGWNEDELYSGAEGWVTETEINEVCATLAKLKSEIK